MDYKRHSMTLGFTFRTLCDWQSAAPLAGPDSNVNPALFEDIPMDAKCGGLFLLAMAITRTIEETPFSYDGLFLYDHVLANNKSIWLPTALKLTQQHWYDLCCNEHVPAWIQGDIVATMGKIGLLDDASEPRTKTTAVINNPTINFAEHCSTLGFIMRQMSDWEENLSDEDSEALLEGNGMDAVSSGLMLCALMVTEVLATHPPKYDGMVLYDHCQADGKSIWLPTLKKLTHEDWYELCGNGEYPEWMSESLTTTMCTLGLTEQAA
ncbi:hypothetical protein RYA05_02290 [Pseudomonas syringae pv. actinidiae]|nr:hypothetical protein [Pseudomonas syringae pv. actinidiae]